MKSCKLLLAILLTLSLALAAGAECRITTFVPEVLVFKGVEMVALRPLAELLGTEARWNTITNVVYLTRGGKNFTCRQNSATARANNQTFTLPLPAFARAGVLYAPLQQTVEALGGTVSVEKARQRATVTFHDPEQSLSMKLNDFGADGPERFRDSAPQFYCISLYGNNLRRLTYYTFDWVAGNLPGFSPDGKQMAYYHDDALCLRAVDGIEEKRLVSVDHPVGSYISPVFQPGGDAIVFGDPQMQCYDLVAARVRDPFTEGEFVKPREASHSADKSKTVFAKNEPPAIFMMNADGTGVTQLTKARTGYEHDSMPAFSPDGASIVFKRSDDLFAMNSDTTQLRRLNPPGTQVIEFTFTPDGSQVVFSARPEKRLGNDR